MRTGDAAARDAGAAAPDVIGAAVVVGTFEADAATIVGPGEGAPGEVVVPEAAAALPDGTTVDAGAVEGAGVTGSPSSGACACPPDAPSSTAADAVKTVLGAMMRRGATFI
jgi:hypothetical protein